MSKAKIILEDLEDIAYKFSAIMTLSKTSMASGEGKIEVHLPGSFYDALEYELAGEIAEIIGETYEPSAFLYEGIIYTRQKDYEQD